MITKIGKIQLTKEDAKQSLYAATVGAGLAGGLSMLRSNLPAKMKHKASFTKKFKALGLGRPKGKALLLGAALGSTGSVINSVADKYLASMRTAALSQKQHRGT